MSGLAQAWQGALAAEQQAVFGYDVLGPHLVPASVVTLARDCQAAHETLRDSTAGAITATGEQPAAPPADYPALYPVTSARAAEKLAIKLEQDASAAWRFAYAAAAETTGPAAERLRTVAQLSLIDSAVRATRWRITIGASSPTVAFPGI